MGEPTPREVDLIGEPTCLGEPSTPRKSQLTIDL